MIHQKLSESVLKKIQKEHIAPKSKWYFFLKNAGFWAIFNLSVLLSAGGFSVILFALLETDFDLFSYLGSSGAQFWWSILPFFWILFCTTFVWIALWGAHHTKTGYRFSTLRLLMVNLGLGVVLGGLFYSIGGAEHFEAVFAERVPLYKGIHKERLQRWAHAEDGRIAGEILEIKRDKVLLLNAFDNIEWSVDYKKSVIRGPGDLQEGMKVRVIGEKISNDEFEAHVIGPWKKRPGPGGRFPRRGGREPGGDFRGGERFRR